MKPLIEIRAAAKTYAIQKSNTMDFVAKYMKEDTSFFVIDKTVYEQYAGNLSMIPAARLFVLEAKEENKTLESALEICEHIMQRNSKRNTHLISMGGGVIQDVTGFVANILYRGIHWTFVPTTLLSACDSCIGGKTSLNYKSYKNILGTFFPPDTIILRTEFLKTLSRRELLSGLGEVVKFNIIAGKDAMQELEKNLEKLMAGDLHALETFVISSLTFKKRFIEADEFDTGERIKLNFAHTFGHAIEVCSEYAIPHGTAVAMGTVTANALSVARGMMSQALADRIEALLSPIIEIHMPETTLKPEGLLSAIGKDKKQINANITAILLDDAFVLHRLTDVQVDEVLKGFAHLESFLRKKQAGEKYE